MRICIVGCGAVGSLFAANLATLDDVEVWAFDLYQGHVDAIERDGLTLSGAGSVHARLRATSDPAALPPCDFGIVATKAMHADSALAGDRARLRRRCRCVRDERRRERGDARAPRLSRDPRNDVPGGEAARTGARAVGREGRHDVLPVRAGARIRGRRSPHSRTHARAAACRPPPSPTRGPPSGAR